MAVLRCYSATLTLFRSIAKQLGQGKAHFLGFSFKLSPCLAQFAIFIRSNKAFDLCFELFKFFKIKSLRSTTFSINVVAMIYAMLFVKSIK